MEASELRRQLTQRGRRKAPEVSVEVDSEPENEWLTELQQAQVMEGTLREEREDSTERTTAFIGNWPKSLNVFETKERTSLKDFKCF